ncbi:MAG: hypothetical protein KF716_28570 [Anaerolineae bacterium]|nr:hypothetical protein [Anaerolineae bacterium]
MTLIDFEQRLLSAQNRLKKATAALAPKHIGGEWEAYQAAYQEVISLERQIAAIKNESLAVPIEFPVAWDCGAPLPVVISNNWRTFLIFLSAEADEDGNFPFALVEFKRSASVKFGSPNDEVFRGHPLYGRGLEPYTAQRVINSAWITELENINKVHHGYSPDMWRSLIHYVSWFHDSTFECVAASFVVEIFHESLLQIMTRIHDRL